MSTVSTHAPGWRWLSALLVLAFAAGCGCVQLDERIWACSPDGRCRAGEECRGGFCFPAPDGGPAVRVEFETPPLLGPDSGLPDYPLGACLGPLKLVLKDAVGAVSPGPAQVQVSARPPGLELYSTPGCAGATVSSLDFSGARRELWARSATGRSYSVTASLGPAQVTQLLPLAPVVRRGTCVFPGQVAQVDCPVDPPVASTRRAFVLHSPRLDTVQGDAINLRCSLADASTLRCDRLTNGGPTDGASIAWQVAEQRELSVQRVESRCDGGVPLPMTVAAANTVLLASQAHTGSQVDDDDFASTRLAGPGMIETTVGLCEGAFEQTVQVVSHPAFSVRELPRTLAGGTGLASFAVASSELSLLQYTIADGASGVCDRALRARRTSATTVAVTRGLGNAACWGGSSALLLTALDPGAAGAVLAPIDVELGASQLEVVVTLTAPVDPTRTLVFTGSLGPPGMGFGETQLIGNTDTTDNMGVALFTAELIDDGGSPTTDQLRVRRGAGGSEAAVTVQLLTLTP